MTVIVCKKYSGVFLVIDEINGIADKDEFAHLIKGLVDLNAMADCPLPLLLMMCGVPDRRRAMIKCYEPVARIFDVIHIENMNDAEMGAAGARSRGAGNLLSNYEQLAVVPSR